MFDIIKLGITPHTNSETVYSTQEALKENVDALNRYIQWMVYDDMDGADSDNILTVLRDGAFIVSRVCIYSLIQGCTAPQLREKSDKASLYYVEFFKEFGFFPGLFECASKDTAMFIFEKTLFEANSSLTEVAHNTSHNYKIMRLFSALYINHLDIICRSISRTRSSAACSESTTDLIVSRINSEILPEMRNVIQYSMSHTEKELEQYIAQKLIQ